MDFAYTVKHVLSFIFSLFCYFVFFFVVVVVFLYTFYSCQFTFYGSGAKLRAKRKKGKKKTPHMYACFLVALLWDLWVCGLLYSLQHFHERVFQVFLSGTTDCLVFFFPCACVFPVLAGSVSFWYVRFHLFIFVAALVCLWIDTASLSLNFSHFSTLHLLHLNHHHQS